MHNSFDYKFINKLIKYGSIFLLSLLSLIVFYYIGIINIIVKIIKCLIPVLFAIILSFIMEPIILFFTRRKLKRHYSVLLSYFLFVLVIALIILIILPSFIAQLEVLIQDLPTIIEEIDVLIKDFLFRFGIELEMNDIIGNTVKNIIPNVSKMISGVFSLITIIGIVFIGALYLSFDYPKLKNTIKKMIPIKYKKEIIPFFHKFEYFCYRYVYGILFDALILWILASGGFTIVGLEYAIVFGFLVAAFDLIPYIGPIIGGAPAVIVALTINPKFALIVLAIVLISQFIESNITQPLILKSVISLHPLEGIIGILVLGTLFGFVGMVISPIIVTFIKLFIPYLKKILYIHKLEKNASK